MDNGRQLEKILWSVALPGFAQFLNGKIVKGIVIIGLEILINVQANLNIVIVASFHGDIEIAIEFTNYQWLMFYPCIYLFAIWDAYRDAGGGTAPYSFLPFVFSAYFGTVGVIYSPTLKIMGVLLGPVWLPILFFVIGLGVGSIIKHLIKRQRGIQN
jgi:hypothetical protein